MSVGNVVKAAAAVLSFGFTTITCADPGFYFGVNAGGSSYDVERSDLATPVLLPNLLVTPPGSFGLVAAFGYIGPGGSFQTSARPAGWSGAGAPGQLTPPPMLCVTCPMVTYTAATPDRERLDTSGASLRVEAGYRFNSYFATELAYLDLGTTSYEATYTLPAPFVSSLTQRSEVEVDGLALSLLGSYPFTQRWSAFARGGYFFGEGRVRRNFGQGGFTTPDYSFDNAFVATGVDFAFADRWGARLEYQRYFDVGGRALRNESDVDSWSLGLQYRL